ncbi:LTA synthase family protein [Clostridium gasigenes]|uniref:LTA synthase family protein n=1 Tax=Clostridium gasigenes TaxID=94869 RepID=A0A7X0SDB6_9CLOT|nr:LTA synthase family protein [Clostridium gasigenes]MBB6714157.1 LTA synthase family protein [Clostridium gasigenes]
MDKLFINIKSFFKNKIGIEGFARFILFIIPLIAIVLKSILFQGFLTSENPYDFDFNKGYSTAKSFLMYYYAFTLFILSFALLFKGKGRIIYLFATDFFITVLIIADLGYFRGFLTLPSALLLTQTSNMDNMGATILSMFSKYDVLFFIDFIIMGLFLFFNKKLIAKVKRRAPISFVISIIITVLYIGYVPFNLYILHNEEVENAWIFSNYDPTNTAKFFSPVGYHAFDLYTVYRDSKPYELTKEEQLEIDNFFKNKQENLPDNKYAGMFKDKNLIVIQVESLESFIIGKEVNNQKLTPVMDNLINTGLYFPNIYEQVNEGTSSDCDLMVNTSMLPLRRGSTFFRYPNTTYNSLPLLLKDTGYETAAIHSDKGSFWNYVGGLTGIGFENFLDYFSFNMDEEIGMGLSDESYFKQLIPKLKDMKDPFYSFTVTLTSHGPFDLPDEYRKLGLDTELANNEMGGYFESIKYTDAAIGNFLKSLDSEGLLDNTVVVIEGDHTGVHKYYNNSIDKLSNPEEWYKDTGHPTVPFIIWNKDIEAPKTFDTIGGQIDIMPTLLYAMGVPSEKYSHTALGRNLLNTNKSFSVLTNNTLVEEGLSEEEKEMHLNILDLSDKMIRSNYLAK